MNKWTEIPQGYPIDQTECFIALRKASGWEYAVGIYNAASFKFITSEGLSVDVHADIEVAWVKIEPPE